MTSLHEAMAAEGIPSPSANVKPNAKGYSRWGKNNRYWFKEYEDGASFGDFNTCEKYHWFEDNDKQLDAEQVVARKAKKAERMKQQEEDEARMHEDAAIKALNQWNTSAEEGYSPYLDSKQVEAFGVRFDSDALVIPLRDINDKLWSLQTIKPDGSKLFASGGKKKGCFHYIGSLESAETIYIGEGYATMASIRAATTQPCVVAFDVGNLEPVTKTIREKYPSKNIVIVADNDCWKPEHGNPGKERAEATAKLYNCKIAMPVFSDTSSKPTDFNDLHSLEGLELVKAQLERALVVPSEAPQPILSTLPTVHPLVPEMIPESIRSWLVDEAERLNVPLDFVTIPALITLSAIIGNRVCIQPKQHDYGWLVTPNLWGGIIGRPSVMKSPAISQAMRPLKKIEAEAADQFSEDNRYYQAELKSYEAKVKAIESQMRNQAEGKLPKKGQVQMSQDELVAELASLVEPAPVYPKRFRTSDSTVEKLGDLLSQNPRGLLVDRDELMGLLSSFDKEGREGDRAFYLEGWNGYGQYTVDRISRGTIHIENLCLSILGSTQPDKIQKYLYRATHQLENDGLIQRFQLLVYPDAQEPRLIDKKPDLEAFKQAQNIFEKLASAGPTELGAKPDEYSQRHNIGFSFEGFEVFNEWYNQLSELLKKEEEPLIQEHLGKYRSLMPKLALLFHLIDVAGGEVSTEVSAKHAKLAAAWCGYLESHARRIYSLGLNGEREAAQSISKKLVKGVLNDGFTVRDVRLKGWRLLRDNRSIEDALTILESHGWVTAIEHKSEVGGRPTIRYHINPQVRGM